MVRGLPRFGQLPSLILRPIRPLVGRIRNLVVYDENTAGLEVLVDPAKSFEVMLPVPTQAEASAEDDGLVPARQKQLVYRLGVEVRFQTLAFGSLTAHREHVV